MKYSKKAFTLVELVVVAVILSILATVGFISYEEYLTDTRDSKRLSQLTGLRDGLRLGITKGQLPLPDDTIEIRNNGTPFLYQGYAGENVLGSIAYSEATKDPFDDTYYTYLLSRNRKDFQLMGFLEKYNPNVMGAVVSGSYADVDYTQRYPRTMGKKIGIVLKQETNIPLQEISEYVGSGYMDLQDSTTNEFDAYITNTYIISGKERDLAGIIPNTNCKKILEMGLSYGNGPYNINPSGLEPIDVYCLMDTDYADLESGWMLVARSVTTATEDFRGTEFGWDISRGSISNTSEPYSFGVDIQDVDFDDILFTTYTNGYQLDQILKIRGVDSNVIHNMTNNVYEPLAIDYINISDTSRVEENRYYGRISSPDYSTNGEQPERYYLGREREGTAGLNAEKYYFYVGNRSMNGEPGMIFVR